MPDIVSPIDGRRAYSFERLDRASALARVEAAEQAQRDWRRTELDQRIALCLSMLDAYEAHLDEFSEQITRMMGKPLAQARAEFASTMRERVLHLCEIAPGALQDDVLPAKAGFSRRIRREPVGVVLDIAAWNYPLIIAINVVVPAVLAGNAVLIKHASQTTLVADQIERAFAEAGAPAGLVTAFPVDHEVAAAVIGSRRIGYVSFTGSVRGGHEVFRTVAEQSFAGVSLELGGKDPALVLSDAPLDYCVENLVEGVLYNAGQSCCAVERIYVHEQLFDAFVEAFAERVHAYRVGDPLDPTTTVGPLVNAAAAAHVRAQVAEALSAGARRVTDPGRFAVPDLSPCYLAPDVLVDVDHDMALMTEETFGPAVGLMAFHDNDEAVGLANDSRYGLTASIWTADEERGFDLAGRIDAGTVYVNRCDYLDPALAWTGIKDSGFGCSLSTLGFLQVTRPKSFHVRMAPR